jgi:hypothetical protein
MMMAQAMIIPNHDINKPIQNIMEITPPPGMSNDDLSRALLAADCNYQTYYNNMIPYSVWGLPTPDLQDYNSNSYISGILNAVGVNGEDDMSQLQENGIDSPGWDKRVPIEAFASPGCQ